MGQNNNNIVSEAIEVNENLSPQIPKTLFKNIKKAVSNTINLDEFRTRLKTVDQNANIEIGEHGYYILASIKNFKGRRYKIEHQLISTSYDDGVYFNISVFGNEVGGDLYYNVLVNLGNKDGVFKAKKVNTKPLVEQYNSFRQEYFNRVSITLLKTLKQFKEDGVEPVVISTIRDISQLIQKNTFAIPVTYIPTENQSLNSAFKRLYDKL